MGYSFATLNSSSTISDVNNNFAQVEAKLGNITNADLAAEAGITSQKLRDRYAVSYQAVVLGNTTWGGDFTFDNTSTFASIHEARLYPEFPGGRAYLVACSFAVQVYNSSSDEAQAYLTLDGTEIGSVSFTESELVGGQDGNAVGYIRNGEGPAAFASPLAAISNGSYLGLRLGLQSGSTPPTAQSVTCVLTFKVELTS